MCHKVNKTKWRQLKIFVQISRINRRLPPNELQHSHFSVLLHYWDSKIAATIEAIKTIKFSFCIFLLASEDFR